MNYEQRVEALRNAIMREFLCIEHSEGMDLKEPCLKGISEGSAYFCTMAPAILEEDSSLGYR